MHKCMEAGESIWRTGVHSRAWQAWGPLVKALSARPSTLDLNSSKGFKWASSDLGFRESPAEGRVEVPRKEA